MITCSKGCKWSGLNRAHCGSGCHNTFNSVNGFDKHRRHGECRNPQDIHMESRQGNGFVYWVTPLPQDTSFWGSSVESDEL